MRNKFGKKVWPTVLYPSFLMKITESARTLDPSFIMTIMESARTLARILYLARMFAHCVEFKCRLSDNRFSGQVDTDYVTKRGTHFGIFHSGIYQTAFHFSAKPCFANLYHIRTTTGNVNDIMHCIPTTHGKQTSNHMHRPGEWHKQCITCPYETDMTTRIRCPCKAHVRAQHTHACTTCLPSHPTHVPYSHATGTPRETHNHNANTHPCEESIFGKSRFDGTPAISALEKIASMGVGSETNNAATIMCPWHTNWKFISQLAK